MSGAERPALDSEPPSLTHTLGVLATICEQDESLTPMDRGIRTALVEALRRAQGELRERSWAETGIPDGLDGVTHDAYPEVSAQ